jgi:Flp pilus assembly protein TadD
LRKASTLRIGDLRKLRDAVEKNPDSAVAHLRLGTALLKAGRLKTAEEALRRSVELEPGFAEAWSNLGGLLLT